MKASLYLHNYDDMHDYEPDSNLTRYELNFKVEFGRQF